MFESMLLGFPRLALFLIRDDASVWDLYLSVGSSRSTISNCVRAISAIRAFSMSQALTHVRHAQNDDGHCQMKIIPWQAVGPNSAE